LKSLSQLKLLLAS